MTAYENRLFSAYVEVFGEVEQPALRQAAHRALVDEASRQIGRDLSTAGFVVRCDWAEDAESFRLSTVGVAAVWEPELLRLVL